MGRAYHIPNSNPGPDAGSKEIEIWLFPKKARRW